ncbi:MAG: hypothetical protein WAT36_08945 [Chromatiaceae bacterium]
MSASFLHHFATLEDPRLERNQPHAVRGHWGVENRPHWRRDLIFREDASRIR